MALKVRTIDVKADSGAPPQSVWELVADVDRAERLARAAEAQAQR
jgi:hypothetical protein